MEISKIIFLLLGRGKQYLPNTYSDTRKNLRDIYLQARGYVLLLHTARETSSVNMRPKVACIVENLHFLRESAPLFTLGPTYDEEILFLQFRYCTCIMAVLTSASCIMGLGTGYHYTLGVTVNCDNHISGARFGIGNLIVIRKENMEYVPERHQSTS